MSAARAKPAEAPAKPARRPGIRELSKQESQHKIMVAARHLFAELGYDRATLRQIAARAGLTVGALFNHVTDKRDLIYLIFNEEVSTISEVALAAPRPYQTISDKILSVTEHYFRLFGSEPVLSRILLSEVVIQTPGMHLERYLEYRNRLLDGITSLIRDAQSSGEIQSTEDSKLIARHVMFTLQAALRWWLADSARPEWRAGHNEYQRYLVLQLHGVLGPAAAAKGKPAKAKSVRKKSA